MSNSGKNTVIHIVAGPTAGGKSAFALNLARQCGGVVINADSMQIYDGLAILTAQPSDADKKSIPHLLYGALHPNENCSAGIWREMAGEAIGDVLKQNKTPIVVGGTGLYIKALLEGLSDIPQTPADIREAVVRKQKEFGNPGFHEELKKRDPVMAARFHPNHTARLVRAWEVLEHTGRSLADWQKEAKLAPPAHWRFEIHKIMPDRAELHRRCEDRFLKMLDHGALEEVSAFNRRTRSGDVRPDALLMNALGYKALRDHLAGKITLENAIVKAQAQTRQYAKRQVTWFRNQL
jgi:tRNA dimethylallyltransferase